MRDLNEQIAEALGLAWKLIDEQYRLYGWVNQAGACVSVQGAIDMKYEHLPPWDEDLNLMHELEDVLSPQEQFGYVNVILGKDYVSHNHTSTIFSIAHATAEQKAIAWLKVKALKGEA